ncbi:MAG: FG-GAP repeat protein, partial [Thermoplasmata archaeon]
MRNKKYGFLICIFLTSISLFSFIIIPSVETKAETWTMGHIQTLTGNSTISNLGDINGDGYDDIGVGEFYHHYGKVYIYFGGQEINSDPDMILETSPTMDEFGCAISSAGDVNGDGFDDVIIGAYSSHAEGSSSGRAYIFHGGDPFDDTPDVILHGENRSYFGHSLSTLYDLNKDGYDDVIVGAPFKDNTGSPQDGSAYVFYGGDPMDTSADLIVDGNRTCWFGVSVSSAGDVNGDEWLDFIVGEHGHNDQDIGAAYVYFGGESLDNISDVNLTNGLVGDNFGRSVSSAGDFNGDGFYDVLVGAPYNNDKDILAGKAYLYLGSPSMDNISDHSWEGRDIGDKFGRAVSNATDINNDGFSDIIVSAIGDGSIYALNSGCAYVYLGNVNLENITEIKVNGLEDFEIFGKMVSSGNFDGDEYSDLLVTSRDHAYVFVYGPNQSPLIEIIEPDGVSDVVDTFYTVNWTDWDPDSNALISLFYLPTFDSQPNLLDSGRSWGINEDDESNQFIWNTTFVDSGSYYIQAKIDDGINPVFSTFSQGKVTINHHPTISFKTPNYPNDDADENFTIIWNDKDNEDNATISLFYDTDNSGNDGTLIASGIGEDDELDMYIWNTSDMPEGNFYLYAEINDGINPIYTKYSRIPLKIHHKMPVLSVTKIENYPTSPREGEAIIVNATILNSGDGIAKNIMVKLIIDGVDMDEILVEEILPDNNTYEVVFEAINLGPGSHNI